MYICTFNADVDHYLSVCEQVMRQSGTMDQTIMHCIFVGPAGVGKSSLLKRLLRMKLNQIRTSTQAAERSVQVEIIRDVSTTVAQVSDFDWKIIEDPKTQASGLIGQLSRKQKMKRKNSISRKSRLMRQLSTKRIDDSIVQQASAQQENVFQGNDSVGSNKKEQVSKQIRSDSPEIYSPAEGGNSSELSTDSQTHQYNMSMDFFRKVLKEKGVSGLKEHVDNKRTLYLTDSGGQPEFQELLSALVVGPCVFFIVFPLDKDLQSRYEVEYVRPDEQKCMRKYLSSLTVEEDLLRSLGSIAFTEYKDEDGNQIKPRVMLVATFKDKVSQEECLAKIDDIKALVKKTDAYSKGMILDASETQMVFTINNASDDESDKDAKKIRDALQIISDDFKVHTPAPWLIFSTLMQHEFAKDSVISKYDCFEVARECGIKSPTEFEAALQFLHKQTGVLHYYTEPSDLNQIVIRDPQYVFSMVNQLVERTFVFEKTLSGQCTEYFNRGLFTRADYVRLTKGSCSKLTPSMLLDLLEHLNVIVPLGDGENKNDDQKKYFMPCAITHLEEASSSDSTQSGPIPPLLITFKCGYCPKGLFGSLVACIANKQVVNSTLDLDKSKIFRDQICFKMNEGTLRLRVRATHVYIEIIPCHPNVPLSTLSILCNGVRKLIFENIDRACKTLHYSLKAHKDYFLSFEGWCNECKKCHPVVLQPVLKFEHLLKVHSFQCNHSLEKVEPSLCWYAWLPEVSRQLYADKNVHIPFLSNVKNCDY